MDKSQLKILKEIRNAGAYDYTADPEWKVEKIHFLASLGYVRYEADEEAGRRYCIVQEKGRAAIYGWYRERRRWFIPVVISVFSAIGAYRKELALAAQALIRLLRSIAGG